MIAWPYLLLACAGMAAAWWGLRAAHRLPPPKDIAGALAFVLGVCAAVLGLLLTVLPDFFSR